VSNKETNLLNKTKPLNHNRTLLAANTLRADQLARIMEEGDIVEEVQQDLGNPSTNNTKKKKRNRRKKKNQMDNPTDGNASPSPVNPGRKNPDSGDRGGPVRGASSGFSAGDAYLSSLGLSTSGRIEMVNFVPKTEGFFKTVTSSYSELCALKPEATQALSLAEWVHCHALMLYARIANCEFDATGYKQPAPTRIPLPYDLKVFQPIFAMLSNLGVVEDPELFVKYIPHCEMPRSDFPSAEDVEKTLDCTMYPWMLSWKDALEARESRSSEYSEKITLDVETQPYCTLEEFKELRKRMTHVISDLHKISNIYKQYGKKKFDDLSDEELEKIEELNKTLDVFSLTEDKYTYQEYSITEDNVTEVLNDVYADAKALKFDKFRPNLTTVRQDIIDWKFEDDTVDRHPGAYGARLGWDPLLWKNYDDFVRIVKPLSLFSISFPRETKGTYAWLLPVKEDPSGFFPVMPKAMPPPVWIGALLLDASTLPTRRVSTWYGETDRLQYPDAVRVKYIKKAISEGMAVEQFHG
jgi:hypothetical protein